MSSDWSAWASTIAVLNTADLKTVAGHACIEIFHDYEEQDVLKMPPSIQRAWYAGRALATQAGPKRYGAQPNPRQAPHLYDDDEPESQP